MVRFSFFPERGWARVSPDPKHLEQILHPAAFQSHVNTPAQRFLGEVRETMKFMVNKCKLTLLWTPVDQAHVSAWRKELLFSWLLYVPDLDTFMSGNRMLPSLFFFLFLSPSFWLRSLPSEAMKALILEMQENPDLLGSREDLLITFFQHFSVFCSGLGSSRSPQLYFYVDNQH